MGGAYGNPAGSTDRSINNPLVRYGYYGSEGTGLPANYQPPTVNLDPSSTQIADNNKGPVRDSSGQVAPEGQPPATAPPTNTKPLQMDAGPAAAPKPATAQVAPTIPGDTAKPVGPQPTTGPVEPPGGAWPRFSDAQKPFQQQQMKSARPNSAANPFGGSQGGNPWANPAAPGGQGSVVKPYRQSARQSSWK